MNDTAGTVDNEQIKHRPKMEGRIKDVDKNTTVLYKKSISSMRRHSRNSSLQGQEFSRSGKQNEKLKSSREHESYNVGARTNRDLSVETDICKMRNNIRRGLKKHGYQDDASLKSKFSVFADGDSLLGREESEAPSSFQNKDVVTLIVDNFRSLLKKWISEYLVDSSDNLQKIEAIRESLIRKPKPSNNSRSSFLNIKMHKLDARRRAKDINTKCEPNCSNSLPFQSKELKFISTLSLPRNIAKKAITSNDGTNNVINLNPEKKMAMLSQPKEMVEDSTLLLVTLSSKSFTRHCVNYNETDKDKENETSRVNFPVKNTPPFELPFRHDQASKMEYDVISIVQSIYEEIQPQVKINPKGDKDTMTDQGSCSGVHERILRRKSPKKLPKFNASNINYVKNKHFANLYRKAKRDPPSNDFVNNFQDIIHFISTYGGEKNISFDVQVNVLPDQNPVLHEETVCNTCARQLNTTISDKKNCGNLETLLEFHESQSSSTKATKSSESEYHPEIISLLDGSESRGKYIVETENESIDAENVALNLNNREPTVLDDKLNICHQIYSLKNVIKGLTVTAEKLIVEQLRKTSNTESTAVQVEPSYCDAAINKVQSSQNTTTSINLSNQPYALWFSQDPVIYNTIPQIKQPPNSEQENIPPNSGQENNPLDSEQENNKISTSSEVANTPDPKPQCNTNSNNHIKSPLQKETVTKQSKGIQLSCNMGRYNPGLKLQTSFRNTSDDIPPHVKKASFCYIESESVLKVTDMTSKNEIPTYTALKEVGLTCSLPVSSSHFEEIREKKSLKLPPPFVQSSVKIFHCGDGFNKYEANNDSSEQESCECNKTFCSQCHQEKSMEEIDKENLKPLKKTRRLKYFKIGLYGVLLCIPVVAVTIYFTDIKNIWQKALQGKTEATEPNSSSDLRLMLSEFGF